MPGLVIGVRRNCSLADARGTGFDEQPKAVGLTKLPRLKDGKGKARPPVALIMVVGVDVKGRRVNRPDGAFREIRTKSILQAPARYLYAF
jgi:hypothetical protein